jgi:hypothetical protein
MKLQPFFTKIKKLATAPNEPLKTPKSSSSKASSKKIAPKDKKRLLLLGLNGECTQILRSLFPGCSIKKATSYSEWIEFGTEASFDIHVIADEHYTFEAYAKAVEENTLLIRIMHQDVLKSIDYARSAIQLVKLTDLVPQYIKLDFKNAFSSGKLDLFHSTAQFENFGDFPPEWYSTESVKDVKTDKEKVLYVPWMKTHGDKFVQQVQNASSDLQFIPFDILKDIERRDYRTDAIAFARSYPILYKQLLIKKLIPIHKTIKKAVVTFDWQPCMSLFVEACHMLGIKTVLVPHESVFASTDLYYKCLVTGQNIPSCDLSLLWGGVQHRIFTERGYDTAKMKVLGTPKLDEYHNYTPLVNKAVFCNILGLDVNKPIALFATQLLDSQFESPSAARKAQNNAIKDMMQWCYRNDWQFAIRTPPSKDNILFNSTKEQIAKLGCGIIDDARLYMFPPEEMLYHADMVLSFNSTMLFEATLLNKPAISTRYVEFEALWASLGIPVADTSEALEHFMNKALEARSSLATEEGMEWAAQQFSNGVFDGQAAKRIAEAILEA